MSEQIISHQDQPSDGLSGFIDAVRWGHRLLGLDELTLEQLPNPAIYVVESADGARNRYQVFGDLQSASNLALMPLNYSTRLDDPSVRVGLDYKQRILGEDYAVVGVEVFSPAAKLTDSQRKAVATGDFRPFAARLDTVVDHLGVVDDLQLFSHGFSFGADIVAQYAHSNTFDAKFGNHAIESYGIFDPSRTKPRLQQLGRLGASLAVELNFAGAGGDLYNNVIASDSVALLQANGIDPKKHFAKQRFMTQIAFGLPRYVAANRADNWALIAGFGTSETVNQINELADSRYIAASRSSNQPTPEAQLVLGEVANGISPGFLHSLQPSPNQRRYLIEGDHSVADNLKIGSALLAATVYPWYH